MAELARGPGTGQADAGGRAVGMGAGRLSGQKKENPHLPVVRIVSLEDFSQAHDGQWRENGDAS